MLHGLKKKPRTQVRTFKRDRILRQTQTDRKERTQRMLTERKQNDEHYKITVRK